MRLPAAHDVFGEDEVPASSKDTSPTPSPREVVARARALLLQAVQIRLRNRKLSPGHLEEPSHRCIEDLLVVGPKQLVQEIEMQDSEAPCRLHEFDKTPDESRLSEAIQQRPFGPRSPQGPSPANRSACAHVPHIPFSPAGGVQEEQMLHAPHLDRR